MADGERRTTAAADPRFDARFAAMYHETAGRVYAYCYRRVGSRSDAEDAASDVYLVAWRRKADLYAANSEMAWLYAVARRIVANRLRSRRRTLRLLDRVRWHQANSAVVDIAPRVVASIDAARQAGAILEVLDPLDQEIVRLSYWEDLAQADVARIVGLREGTVRSRLFRVRQSLLNDSEMLPEPDRGEEAP